MQKEYIEREALLNSFEELMNIACEQGSPRIGKAMRTGTCAGIAFCRNEVRHAPAADVIEADRLGRVGRLMLPNKGCPRGPIGRLGMAGGKTQDKKAILIEELCCMDTFEDVDGNVWRPVQEEVLQEVIEILRAQSTVLTVEGKTIIIKEYPDDFDAKATVELRWFNDEKNQYEGVYATCQYNILTVREMLKITEELFRTVNREE